MSPLLLFAGCSSPPPVPEAGSTAVAAGCEPLLVGDRPLAVPAPSPLEPAAAWSLHVDAVGAYGHQVVIDAASRAVWTQDSANMRFTVRTVAADGEVLRVQVLDPPTMAPGVLATDPDGTVLAGGTVYRGDGPGLTAIGPDGTVRWHQGTPRVRVSRVASLPAGAWAVLGNSGRDSVTLGDTTHTRGPGWLGSSMDVLAVLDADGNYRWSKAFYAGAMDLAVQKGDLFVAGHFGADGWVDYGGGSVFATGVLARLRPDGTHVWSKAFDEGLFAVVPWGDDAVLVNANGALVDGGEVFTRTRLYAVGLDGCDRGSVDLGDLPRLQIGLDGALLAYGLRIDRAPRLGATALDVPRMQWWITRFTADLEVAWVHTVECESLEVAGGPRGETAVSCFRDLSVGPTPKRRTLLFWLSG